MPRVGGRRPRAALRLLDQEEGRLPEPADGLRAATGRTPSAFDSPFGGAAWSQPETPGVSNAPPSFEDHVANPMRGGYEAPGIEDPEGVAVILSSLLPCVTI